MTIAAIGINIKRFAHRRGYAVWPWVKEGFSYAFMLAVLYGVFIFFSALLAKAMQ
jgi:hypothetical protein